MSDLFQTDAGMSVPSVTVGQMGEVDRIAIDHHTPNLHQMMENAGHRGTWRVDPIDGGVVTVRFDAEVRRIPGASTLAAKLSEWAESGSRSSRVRVAVESVESSD